MQISNCLYCGESFASRRAWDKHLVIGDLGISGPKRCLNTAQMVDLGMVQDASRRWRITPVPSIEQQESKS